MTLMKYTIELRHAVETGTVAEVTRNLKLCQEKVTEPTLSGKVKKHLTILNSLYQDPGSSLKERHRKDLMSLSRELEDFALKKEGKTVITNSLVGNTIINSNVTVGGGIIRGEKKQNKDL